MKSNQFLTLIGFLTLIAPAISSATIICSSEGIELRGKAEVKGTVKSIKSKFKKNTEVVIIETRTGVQCEVTNDDIARVRSIKPSDSIEMSNRSWDETEITLTQ